MPKQITVELPDEIVKIIERILELKNRFVSKLIKSIVDEFTREISKGKVSKYVLDYLAKEKDVY